MGWTSYVASHYKNGKVDRKAEMDEIFTQKEHDGYPEMRVLKSVMVGSTYYAAVNVKDSKKNTNQTFGVVALTSTRLTNGMNFAYKDMGESMGPYYYDCPESILNLLSPTDNEYALEWRKRCREKIKAKKEKRDKASLPVGTTIRYKRFDGRVVVLTKTAPAYQFKRPFWYNAELNVYVPSRRIPENFEIIKEEK